ncbi:hypothetical protein CKM354_001140000 [Cercospora kikuchii]|uniref:Uncharacterized protein n=1 Tax=Cercospora kikuchii TaxID=84275 RepID=A0A9P3CWZ1_9PEZI|nr:uncharacterized protein CKM354_001140000 [Cercospora kikuchii]GIZ48335.1 hypothetical protein CKM354_001140000 [Cercospora kikuchii]
MQSLIIAGLAAFAAATPLGGNIFERQVNSPFCSTVSRPCNSAAQTTSVTVYCSEYLKVPAATATTTRTLTTTISSATTITTSATVTSTKSTTSVTTTTVFSGSTITVTSTGTAVSFCNNPLETAVKAKRAIAKPSCLSRYTASAQISSACSCYNIPKATVTSTRTATSTVNRGATIYTGKTTTITRTQTSLITSTATAQRTITTTFYPIASSNPVQTYGFRVLAPPEAGSAIAGKWMITPANNHKDKYDHDDFDEFQASFAVFNASSFQQGTVMGFSGNNIVTLEDLPPAAGGSPWGGLYGNGGAPQVHFGCWGKCWNPDKITCKAIGGPNQTCKLVCTNPFDGGSQSWVGCTGEDAVRKYEWLVGKKERIEYSECPVFEPILVSVS